MGPEALVVGPFALPDEYRRGGERLISRLRDDGVDLRGGAWAVVYDDHQPYLYLVTPGVEDRDPRLTYKKVADAQIALARDGVPAAGSVGDAVKLIPPSRPLAQSILSVYHRYPDEQPTVHRGFGLGSGVVEEAYIYPAALFRPAPQPG